LNGTLIAKKCTVDKSQQHHIWDYREPNPGLLGEMRKCYLCATLPPVQLKYSIAKFKLAKVDDFLPYYHLSSPQSN